MKEITIVTQQIKKELKETQTKKGLEHTYINNTKLINTLINKNKKAKITIIDITYNKNEKNKKETEVENHINKTGENPLRKKQKELKINFVDLTKIYNTTKKGVVTTSLGSKYSQEKQKEKHPSTYLSNIAIVCRAMGFSQITAKLINQKKS